ncbi:hypothetical protein AB0N31_35300 [Streptomyces sp. NPDC051051]|uniref:hypothetical protein n=1 Tax=Streptomyces sp. NPDC051051 TaxID=3155666 RepID=UPI00343021E6
MGLPVPRPGRAHPSASGLPVTPLLELTATAPDPGQVHALLTALGTGLVLREGPAGLSYTVATPNGPVTFT